MQLTFGMFLDGANWSDKSAKAGKSKKSSPCGPCSTGSASARKKEVSSEDISGHCDLLIGRLFPRIKDHPELALVTGHAKTLKKIVAGRLLKNWTVEKGVSPETLMECTDNLFSWIAKTWPEAKIRCEVPMTYHDDKGTLYQGFIDMLLELPDGYVIIDHKTHPMAFDAESYAASCAGQLRLYRKAVEAATGKTVKQTIIHLPNLGMCFDVK